MDKDIILSNLETLPNMDVESHFGLVSGSSLMVDNSYKGILKNLLNLFRARHEEIDNLFENTKNDALDKMVENAKALGANAIINIRLNVIKLDQHCCEVHVYGSAIKANQF